MRSRSQPLSGSEARPVSLLVSEESQYRHEDRRGEEAKVSRPVPVTVLTTRTS
jgi:hypothetical protein